MLSERGIISLANDVVVDELVALLESIATHEPTVAVSVIPFDDQTTETARVVAERGFAMYAPPLLRALDALGLRYWPDNEARAHNMRKLAAFWGPYESFMFVDADIVLVQPIERYFAALKTHDAEFLYFHPDMDNVFRPGGVRDQLVTRHGSVGFNGGAFLSRRDALELETVMRLADSVEHVREHFVDNLEQSFLNYCVDLGGLRKLSWTDAAPNHTAASALMRLELRGGDLYLDDARVADSGRPVTFIHWAGYPSGPLMPYRSIFRRYRLGANASFREKMAYELRALITAARRTGPRTAHGTLCRARFRIVNWLAARGVISWPR